MLELLLASLAAIALAAHAYYQHKRIVLLNAEVFRHELLLQRCALSRRTRDE